MARRVHSEGHNSFILVNLHLGLIVSGMGIKLAINTLLVLHKDRLGSIFLLDHNNIKHIGHQVQIKYHNRLLLLHPWFQLPKSKLTEILSSLSKDSTMIPRGTN
jgi:hypothetical protein